MRRPRKKPLTPFPDQWTREEKIRIRSYCHEKTPQYLPVDKPGGLTELMEQMRLHFTGEGASEWKRDWVRAAYKWLLNQQKFDFERSMRRYKEKPQQQVACRKNKQQTVALRDALAEIDLSQYGGA